MPVSSHIQIPQGRSQAQNGAHLIVLALQLPGPHYQMRRSFCQPLVVPQILPPGTDRVKSPQLVVVFVSRMSLGSGFFAPGESVSEVTSPEARYTLLNEIGCALVAHATSSGYSSYKIRS